MLGLSIRAGMLSDKPLRGFRTSESPQARAVAQVRRDIDHGRPPSVDCLAALAALLGGVANTGGEGITSAKIQRKVLQTISVTLMRNLLDQADKKRLVILLAQSIPAFTVDNTNSGGHMQHKACMMVLRMIRGEAAINPRRTDTLGTPIPGFDAVPEMNFSRRETAEIIGAIAATLPEQPISRLPGHANNPFRPVNHTNAFASAYAPILALVTAGASVVIGYAAARITARLNQRNPIQEALVDEMVNKLNDLPATQSQHLAAVTDDAPGWAGLLRAAPERDPKHQNKIIKSFLNQMEKVQVPETIGTFKDTFIASYQALEDALPHILDETIRATAATQLEQFKDHLSTEQRTRFSSRANPEQAT